MPLKLLKIDAGMPPRNGVESRRRRRRALVALAFVLLGRTDVLRDSDSVIQLLVRLVARGDGIHFLATFPGMPTVSAEGQIGSEAGVGRVLVSRVSRDGPDQHGSSAFAVGVLLRKKKKKKKEKKGDAERKEQASRILAVLTRDSAALSDTQVRAS